jgi:hypothetical protein
MKVHSALAQFHRAFLFVVLSVALPAVGIAAEVWPDGTGLTTGGKEGLSEFACPLITHDCETCITPVGSSQVVCSMRSDHCTPTTWTCFEGLGSGIGGEERRLVFAQSHARKLETVSATAQKLIQDRVPGVESLADEASERTDIQLPVSHVPSGGYSMKKIQDRLNAEGSVP